MNKHLLTLYTRTPLHVGSGTSVEVVDLPIMRERITNFPVIPSTSLKGVLREECRANSKTGLGKTVANRLFGFEKDEKLTADEEKKRMHAGYVIVSDARLLAFPVRSLAGCFAWLTCPLALERLLRDAGEPQNSEAVTPAFLVPKIQKDTDGSELVWAGADLIAGKQVILEELAFKVDEQNKLNSEHTLVKALARISNESLWTSKLATRLAVVSDDTFQHFVTAATEITARIAINPATRINTNLFNQENAPSEALFYAPLFSLKERTPNQPEPWDEEGVCRQLKTLLPVGTLLQVGGDETTGFGFCSAKFLANPFSQS